MQQIDHPWQHRVYANTGGPMSRTRREQVRSSLIGDVQDAHMARTRRLGLQFGTSDKAVDIVEALLLSYGMQDPEQLRKQYVLPAGPMLAMPVAAPGVRRSLTALTPKDALEEALWLGLCTAYLFDPARPVLWTETSLRRNLQLCEPMGFYA